MEDRPGKRKGVFRREKETEPERDRKGGRRQVFRTKGCVGVSPVG